ncbi:MAG: putative glycoside hydrolase [Eubacteriales bacterium]|nr:putative glycoside hydrolase [Eubacteriales bacterium]
MLLCLAALAAGCARYEPAALQSETISPEAGNGRTAEQNNDAAQSPETGAAAEAVPETPISLHSETEREPVKVKGIYLGANAVGVSDFMDRVITRIDETELNAVVIDVKDDYGRITYAMDDVPLVNEIAAVEVKIGDMPGVIRKLKSHGIYCIARIVALKDPYIAEKKPEWALHLADGSVFRDGKGDAWVNPYKQEYWDYLVDVARACGALGFDEIQFDYIRFCTERGIDAVVYDAADTKGRDKISIISELVAYMSDKLRAEGLFVSCDVFGTIIGSPIDTQSVGQDYTQMAEAIDYICPMIYPSHYASGNFGLEHPDTEPYACILGALENSRTELLRAAEDGKTQAVVRPWLQSFTASYLGAGNYIEYNAETTREQIQAVYDAGYDEWILWSASANYYYDGLLTEEAAEEESVRIAESRAALPPETLPETDAGERNTDNAPSTDEDVLPQELESALSGDDLSESDIAILEQEGAVVISDDSR